ncbi:MAG: triose-phosphate isomerase [Gaiellaceae bacterium]
MAIAQTIAGNWKMFKGPGEAGTFVSELVQATRGNIAGLDVVVCPPATSLAAAVAAAAGGGIDVFAQTVHWADEGAFTGELSVGMLREIGVTGTLVGHSERRQLFGETDETTASRAVAALAGGLRVIACVGELEAERANNETEQVLERQVGALADAVSTSDGLTVAYEPVWAIGTGQTATAEQAQQAHAVIKRLLPVPVLYGGSVKPENATELLSMPDVDGALVGGASLDAASFAAICAAGSASS